jgi:hypothetical protein
MEIKARLSDLSQGATPAFMQGAKQTKISDKVADIVGEI